MNVDKLATEVRLAKQELDIAELKLAAEGESAEAAGDLRLAAARANALAAKLEG